MDLFLKILYIELYVSFLLAAFVYVLYELIKVEKEKAQPEETKEAIAFPRFAVWVLCVGVVCVVIGWLLAFGANAVKSIVKADDPDKWFSPLVKWLNADGSALWLFVTAKWIFYAGMVAIVLSLLVFGYKAAIHPRSAVWFYRGGIVTIITGLFAFCASAGVAIAVEKIAHPNEPAAMLTYLIAGLFNPFFFIGVPLGIYWLSKSKLPSVSRADKR